MSKISTVKILALALAMLIIGAVIGYEVAIQSLPPSKPTEIRIGFIYSLSGSDAYVGDQAKRVFETWFAGDVNKAGGVKSLGGLKITCVWGDHMSKPEIAMAEAERLITQEGVVAIVGARLSSCTLTIAEVCERYKIPLIVPDATSPKLTESNFTWVFRTQVHDALVATRLFEFMKDLQSKKGVEITKLAYVYEDTLFGSTCAEEWKKNNANSTLGGYTVVADIHYSASTTDVSSEVLLLREANPDVILMASYPRDALLFAQTYKQLDYFPKGIFCNDGQKHPDYLAGAGALNNYYCVFSYWNLDVAKAKSTEVAQNYTKLFGLPAEVRIINFYTAIYTLYRALEKAGSLEPAKIREALLALNIPSEEIPQVGGVRFDEKGQNTLAGAIAIQYMPPNGTFRTVFPWDVAAVDLIYPAPSWAERI